MITECRCECRHPEQCDRGAYCWVTVRGTNHRFCRACDDARHWGDADVVAAMVRFSGAQGDGPRDQARQDGARGTNSPALRTDDPAGRRNVGKHRGRGPGSDGPSLQSMFEAEYERERQSGALGTGVAISEGMSAAVNPSKGGKMAKRPTSVAKIVTPNYRQTCVECGKQFNSDSATRFRCSDACYIRSWVKTGTVKQEQADEWLKAIKARNAESLAKMKAAVARRRAQDEEGGLTEGSNGDRIEDTNQQDPGSHDANGQPTEPEQGEEEVTMTTETAGSTETAKKVRKPKAAKKAAKRKAASNGKGIVSQEYRKEYEIDRKNKTASGNPTVSNGDRIAQALRGLDLDACAKVARENKLGDKWAGWSKLNPGQQRMNLGNVLRGLVRKGEGATVQGKVIKSLGGDS